MNIQELYTSNLENNVVQAEPTYAKAYIDKKVLCCLQSLCMGARKVGNCVDQTSMRGRGRGRGRARGRGRSSIISKGQGKSRASAAEDVEHALMPWAEIGDKVEVRSDEEGFIGAWYAAEVVHLDSRSTCVVEYEQLLSDDGLPLQEVVLLSNLRPRPPTLPARPFWLQGHLVEAYDRDGWWHGVVVRPLPDRDLVLVRFRTTGEEIPFHSSLLRGLQNWDDGVWMDLTQAGRPDEEDYMDATDTNGSRSPLYHAELPRKRGRPRKPKLPSMDLSVLPIEKSQLMEPETEPEQFETLLSLADTPVEAIQADKTLYGSELPSMEEPQTPTSANDHFTSALQAFTHCSGISKSTLRLELVAYQFLVKALRLKGPLNWNQERLLADVRLHLNITNAEQTFVLEGFMPS
ncbi:hypothetical protein L7F22_060328 [Adiantum nelumboides]|nr:hypothetical protein [Adiantum nelumboides]